MVRRYGKVKVVGGRDERGLLIIEMEKISLSDGSS